MLGTSHHLRCFGHLYYSNSQLNASWFEALARYPQQFQDSLLLDGTGSRNQLPQVSHFRIALLESVLASRW